MDADGRPTIGFGGGEFKRFETRPRVGADADHAYDALFGRPGQNVGRQEVVFRVVNVAMGVDQRSHRLPAP